MIRLSIIIPAYNEEKTVLQLMQKLCSTPALSGNNVQFIVVDDGSTDKTRQLLETSPHARDSRFTLIYQEKNRGKGAAIRAALPYATGRYTVIQDADLEYNPTDIVRLLEKAEREGLHVVYGSRNADPKTPHGRPLFYWGGRAVTLVGNILFRQKLTDEATCYKLFDTELLRSLPLTCERFEFCPEVTALVAKRGIKIPEIPITYAPRDKSEGKKINWRDGIEALYTFLREWFTLRSPWMQGIFVGLFAFFLYTLTWSGFFGGYEHETAEAAVKLTHGVYEMKRAGVGAALLYAPFVLIGRLLVPESLYTLLTFVPLFYSALTISLLYHIASYFNTKASTRMVVPLLVAAGSLVWPYTRIGMEYQAMFLITLLLSTLLLWREKKLSILFPGLVLGFLTVTKSYGAILALPTLLFILQTRIEHGELQNARLYKEVARLFSPLAVALLFTVTMNWIIHHSLSGAYSLAHEFQIWVWWEGFYGIFFSFGKGILWYSPLLIPVLLWWPGFAKKNKAVAWFVLSSFALLLIITAPFSYWSDETLSVRKLVPIIPLLHLSLVFGLDRLFSKDRLTKAAVGLVIIISIYVQAINSLYYYGTQLQILRQHNLDTLSTLRHIPQLSHITLHHLFFRNIVSKTLFDTSRPLTYQDTTWMRYLGPMPSEDVVLSQIAIETDGFDKPDTYISRSNKTSSSLYAAFNSLALLFSAAVLLASYLTAKRNEKIQAEKGLGFVMDLPKKTPQFTR